MGGASSNGNGNSDGDGRAVAIVGLAAILPDAPDADAFWTNVTGGRYSIGAIPEGRWDPDVYYDADPAAPDKTYSRIGGWVREWDWDPLAWHLPIPPKVGDAMDDGQKWAIACTRAALADFGYPGAKLDPERTAVILGNAMAGELHYMTTLRIYFPEFAEELEGAPSFEALPIDVREAIVTEAQSGFGERFPRITEDTMPGELANIIAGRVANVFDFHGPNFIVDAACASTMAAMEAAVQGLASGEFDTAISGGVDRNMGASAFVKFSKIGALSATGTRPYGEGADGFVMGEGAGVFVMKRLADAERDGDRVYAVVRALAGSSDGRGKGITAPNPIGQRLAVERAWRAAGLSPATVTLVEGHGTSTKVGDVVEVASMTEAFADPTLPVGSIALGSVKSNIGHLKAAAGAAGIMKAVLALHHKVLPPTLNAERPNPDIDFGRSPLRPNTELREWPVPAGGVRRAGVSAFGFGGTNFHAVLEEYVPGMLDGDGRASVAVARNIPAVRARVGDPVASVAKPPLRGALLMGAPTEAALAERLTGVLAEAESGRVPKLAPPARADLDAPERLAIDFADAAELAQKAEAALKALAAANPGMWKALRARGIFRGSGPAPKVAFLYPGQGSQYADMLGDLRRLDPIVAGVFDEADDTMTPFLGRPLSELIFVDRSDPAAVAAAEEELRQTAVTQPAVLAVDDAITRLLAAYGVAPDLVMGHSLGEYAALVAAGALPFADALEAVSARGREMTNVTVGDKGLMAAVFAPLDEVERVVKQVDGYVVIANMNSTSQAVIGGATEAVTTAMARFADAGYEAVLLPVSHAFHTSIVAPASEPLRAALARLRLGPPRSPIVANVSGELYPMGPDVVPEMLDILARQVASPVRFVDGLRTLYAAGVRLFVEVGPKKALQGFVDDVLGAHDDVASLFTNHPKVGDVASFNQALCGLYAAGLGAAADDGEVEASAPRDAVAVGPAVAMSHADAAPSPAVRGDDVYLELGRMFAEFIERGRRVYDGPGASAREAAGGPRGFGAGEPIVITGAALGLPGTEHVFDDDNVRRILDGERLIDVIPTRLRDDMLDKHITRLVKREDGQPTFESIDDLGDVIKLAGRAGAFDLGAEFGVDADRIPALDRSTRLAIGAGIDALRDAGVPLVMRYRSTHLGTKLPERWGLPDELRDETGVIFASAFPGLDAFADEMNRYHEDRARREEIRILTDVRGRMNGADPTAIAEVDRRIHELSAEVEHDPYLFDRRFLFKALSMGHSQFAEVIGARGPNTQVNSACASTTQALAIAEDWIAAGRCRRVVIVSADDATSDTMMGWIGAGFLASGAAATDGIVEDAALPFDRRRHGMIVGMGAAALVVERADAARERGIRPICDVLSTVTANSAFHGTRLDPLHIAGVMEDLVALAESRWGLDRDAMAAETVFVSHETYTPARGGSAAAEVESLRSVFRGAADRVVVANTKGFTGHPMGVGIEDVVAVKSLETGIVPPVPNLREPDPDLGSLNLSKGGAYPVRYALRLAAGFGSQISMSLIRWAGSPDGLRRAPDELGYAYRVEDPAAWNAWLTRVSGYAAPEVEVVQRRLRVKDQGPPSQVVAPAAAVTTSVAPMREMAAPVPAAPAPAPAPAAPAPDAPAPAAPAPAVQVPAGAVDPVQERVLALVAETTGYPSDMLDLDLDLEADLGVDTVKQAEIFATIREVWGIERDDTLKLREFPTLAHVIGFVHDRVPGLDVPPASEAVPASEGQAESAPAAPIPAGAVDPVQERVLALVAETTGYPSDMLDLDLDLEADLGVDTVKQAEIFATIREVWGIERDDTLKLREFPTLAHVIGFVHDRVPGLDVPPASEAVPASEGQAESAPAAPIPAGAVDPVQERVLALVAETTGYPPDMLDLDLDLEADLGVDTVKQAEIFATIREVYGIERDDTLKLREFPTLAHVIGFVHDRVPGLDVHPASQAVPASDGRAGHAEAPGAVAVEDGVAAADRMPRRVPGPVLRPPLPLCVPTGVTVGSGSRIVVMADRGGVAEALTERLRDLEAEVLLVEDAPDAGALLERLAAWRDEGPIQGVYWLPALDDEGPMSAMDLPAWREALRVRVKLLAETMRKIVPEDAGSRGFLLSATRLGGMHGFDPAGASAPLGGAVTGFTKALHRERPDDVVKAVDFETDASPEAIVEALLEETSTDPGAVEIGRSGDLRVAIGLEERPAADGGEGMVLSPESVFVVTGAAGSIVSAIVADLAAASGGTFHLLDLAPAPDGDDPDLARFATDRDGLKRDLFERLKASGKRATPAKVERELARLERADAALSAIRAVEAAGGTARYHSVDLRDPDAVAGALAEARDGGRVDVLLHAAGLEISRMLPDKKQAEFDLVFDVKADGWFNVLHALGETPIGATVAFSSVAGRFGNAGQTDYSAANGLLCATTSGFRTTEPHTRGIAIDWTAWGGIGMATRGSIPKMMDLAGIEMLPPECGIPTIRRELTAGATRGEVLVAGRLGALVAEAHPTGGLDPAAARPEDAGVMVGEVLGMGVYDGLTVETTLDPTRQGFLNDHRIDGTPVLPGVMGIEAFAEAALVPMPGRHVTAVEDVTFLAPFKFYRDEPRTLTVRAILRPDGEDVVADCRLEGVRTLPGQDEPQVTTHFTGRVRLGRTALEPVTAEVPEDGGSGVDSDAVYRVYFHGPAFRVVQRAWRTEAGAAALMAEGLPAGHEPADLPLATAPRLLELCFQTAGLWELGTDGRFALPASLARVTAPIAGDPAVPAYAIAVPAPDGGFDARVVDADGRELVRLEGYRTVELPGGVDPVALGPLAAALA